MSKPNTSAASGTDLQHIDAMRDEEIVYDEDTGPPLTGEEVGEIMRDGIRAVGIADFQNKMKKAAE